ncbi:MAG: NADP-dependent isocitrate dehydrogenase [Myxococcales bacterium]|nr:NADP-dependent isocitrate dehydrogenase [Myxococcales bacterium]MCB9521067.1 NADP-dependent isocitrate dehydrogenase [Myxococcales bacterium]
MSSTPTIVYTKTDEAPALATYSFLPIVRAFAGAAGIDVTLSDISLAGRVLAAMAPWLPAEQRVDDALAQLAELVQSPDANIIKLPNISASIPQLKGAIAELQAQGYAIPDYPDAPESAADKKVRAAYDKVKGSAVNPVIREGNSDRRAPKAVKEFARANPHSMGKWSADSKTHVASMTHGDFFANEVSDVAPQAVSLRIEHVAPDGTVTVLREKLELERGEIFDATFMSAAALNEFYRAQIADARASGVLLSLHLKATMMKVSDPILFGHAVRAYFAPVFERHADALASVGVNANNGFGDVVGRLADLPEAARAAIEADIAAVFAAGPDLAMVDSDRGITNLHVPSDVIIDASMPAMIRTSGQMWNREGKQQDTKAMIPDRTYAGVYDAVIEDCKANGAFDPKTMGSVSNVGLMARAAEEYGSHDKTFQVASAGVIRAVETTSGFNVSQHTVEAGDIWRACQTKDAAVRDWVKLALARARATGNPAVFWLDAARAHDARVLDKVKSTLASEDTTGVELHFLAPADATRFTLARVRQGLDTISVTGNVLRDYLTDLFPILELGTSAKMLSIVPLMNGGGLFETGAGGSAPKHVQQFLAENYLRWDSLGEFLALAVSFEHIAARYGHGQAQVLADTLDTANTQYLLTNKSPARRVGQIDNRGSHFYVALYWAEALANQTNDAALAAKFVPIAKSLRDAEDTINAELLGAQGHAVDIGGYYAPNDDLATAALRSSPTLNAIIDAI